MHAINGQGPRGLYLAVPPPRRAQSSPPQGAPPRLPPQRPTYCPDPEGARLVSDARAHPVHEATPDSIAPAAHSLRPSAPIVDEELSQQPARWRVWLAVTLALGSTFGLAALAATVIASSSDARTNERWAASAVQAGRPEMQRALIHVTRSLRGGAPASAPHTAPPR